MRLVAVADTHLFHDELVIPDGDVFIHAGDLCRAGSLDELAEASRWLRALPHRIKIFIAGNHDWAFQSHPEPARRLLGPEIIYLQDTGTTVEGLRFWGSPWQPAFNDWAFNLPRGPELAEKWALIPEGLDVLVTHGPPKGIGDHTSYGARRAGCADLRERVAAVRPRLHLFGHIHEDGGAWDIDGTTFVNCTTWECERAPTVIDISPGTGEVQVLAPPARPAR
ncbi:MAG TPA: metallophosphatase domain-containing protein [Polyangia bacterium]|jgi:predicted phosphohydrolase|nr:metallophosphatase domain-containing protein [Polyangia bacterium]